MCTEETTNFDYYCVINSLDNGNQYMLNKSIIIECTLEQDSTKRYKMSKKKTYLQLTFNRSTEH